MLFFMLILLFTAGVGIIYGVRNKRSPSPAYEVKKNQLTQTQLKEEFALEKETEAIKERVKSSEAAKIAANKVEEEIGEELTPLKSQLREIQSALNQLESSGQENMNFSMGQNQQQPNDLLKQMEQFSSQAQQQQENTFQQLQKTIHQTTQMLSNVEHSLQSFNMLNQISHQINQSQQQLQQSQIQGQSQQGQGQFEQQDYSNQSYQ